MVNLADSFLAAPPDRTALTVSGRITTFGQLVERVDQWRGGLVASGLKPGDRVALLAGNDEVFVIGYLASLTGGFVSVPLNPQSPPAELRRQLAAVDARSIIMSSTAAEVWSQLGSDRGSNIASVHQQLEQSPEGATMLPSTVISSLEASGPAAVLDIADDAPALLLFTSGTAGDPKPAVLTHGNLASSVQSVIASNADFFATQQIALAVIPLFHVFGVNLILNLCLTCGATMVLEDHTDSARTAELVRDNKVSILAGPPTLWGSLVRDNKVSKADLSSVELAISGASRLEPGLAVEVRDKFGVHINEGYGLTETGGVLSSSVGTDAPIGSVGSLLPGVQARLVDAQGQSVLVGDVGEVWVRGPMLSPGYWVQEPDGSTSINPASQTDDGWLRTGDLAVVDEQGNLAIMTRIKDLIIVSGFNVHPTEVESALLLDPTVAAVGVKGEPDDVMGESVVAYVVPAEGVDVDVEQLRDHCATELARYKIPTRIHVVAALPLNSFGKLRRQDL